MNTKIKNNVSQPEEIDDWKLNIDAPATRGEQDNFCEKLAIQDHSWGVVWYIRKVWRDPSNQKVNDKLLSITHFYRGNATKTKGTAFVVYEDIYDAKNAVDHLNGFNVAGKYLICLYY